MYEHINHQVSQINHVSRIEVLETASMAIRIDYDSLEFVHCTHEQRVTVCGAVNTVHSSY
uniref:Uncharacterized protein n=1 Tax=Arundo donax TaxID=35708 RepID=A0A0A8ZGG7_ARUDO